MSKQTFHQLAGLLVLSVVWFTIGWSLHSQLTPTTVSLAPSMQRMIKASQMILTRHYPSVAFTPDELANAAIRGMLHLTQDRYVGLFTGPVSARFAEDFAGETGAPGLWYKLQEGKFVITALREDGPAAAAGVQVGDVLVAVAGTKIGAFTTGEELAMLLRGPLDTPVTITLQRGSTTLKVRVDRIEREAITARLFDRHIGYVKLPSFQAGGETAMKTILQRLQSQGMEALIWDLRGNAGGSMRAAVAILDDLLDEGIFYTAEFKDGKHLTFRAAGQAFLPDLPLVVLTDDGTFSAAEMVTAALQDHKRALVIGGVTGGKGILQDTITLDTDSRLHLTIAKWLSPNGHWLHHKGVQPNILLDNDPATRTDEVLDYAINQFQSS